MLDSILCRSEKILQPGVNRSGSNRRHLSTRIQSSLLVVDFRFGSILCSHYSRKRQENLSDIYVTIHFQYRSSAASLRHKTQFEIGVLYVNKALSDMFLVPAQELSDIL